MNKAIGWAIALFLFIVLQIVCGYREWPFSGGG
jgi:hypothetical protein